MRSTIQFMILQFRLQCLRVKVILLYSTWIKRKKTKPYIEKRWTTNQKRLHDIAHLHKAANVTIFPEDDKLTV